MEKNKKHKEETKMDNQVDAPDFSAEEINNIDIEDIAEPLVPDETKQELRDEKQKLRDEKQKLIEELEEQKDKYVRLFAEFDNFKRRTSKERLELIQTAGKEVI